MKIIKSKDTQMIIGVLLILVVILFWIKVNHDRACDFYIKDRYGQLVSFKEIKDIPHNLTVDGPAKVWTGRAPFHLSFDAEADPFRVYHGDQYFSSDAGAYARLTGGKNHSLVYVVKFHNMRKVRRGRIEDSPIKAYRVIKLRLRP